jgi:glycosyltransferase involved in cell wall biosynthesis
VVHCHDLDTLYAGWQLKRATGAVLVYDAHEHYPASMSLYLPALFVTLLAWWERRLTRKAEAIITASSVLREHYLARGISRVVALGNYPDSKRFQLLPEARIREARQALGISDDTLLVSYIGGLHRNRMILPFIEAAASCPDAHFAVWGVGDQKGAVEAAVANHRNTRYHGLASRDELPLCFQMSDIIYYGLRLDYPGAEYNAPNTVAQAMIMARPVIATNVGDLGRIVETTGCGVLIDEATPEAIAGAIEELKDTERRQALGENGYEAARRSYNADTVSKRLLELYSTLVP